METEVHGGGLFLTNVTSERDYRGVLAVLIHAVACIRVALPHGRPRHTLDTEAPLPQDRTLLSRVLTFGTRVVVIGYPLRDAAQIRASFPEYKGDTRGPNLVDVAQMRSADNSWNWRAESPPTCTPE
jgi:hypothetical protein